MEAYLAKACRRAGSKLAVGLTVVAAVVGIRIATATPTGVEGEIAELERFERARAAAPAASDSSEAQGAGAGARRDSGSATAAAGDAPAADTRGANARDLDRMVRCALGGRSQFMRASDCATRGGELEELPPPEPQSAATP